MFGARTVVEAGGRGFEVAARNEGGKGLIEPSPRGGRDRILLWDRLTVRIGLAGEAGGHGRTVAGATTGCHVRDRNRIGNVV